jgi:hypothetical protein
VAVGFAEADGAPEVGGNGLFEFPGGDVGIGFDDPPPPPPQAATAAATTIAHRALRRMCVVLM